MDDRELDVQVAVRVMEYISGEIPHYSTDIAAAWPVVEKLCLSVLRNANDEYLVGKFDETVWNGDEWVDGQMVCILRPSEAATAPLAICLAALRVVGVGVPVGHL